MASYESGGEYCQDEVFSKDVFFKRLNHYECGLGTIRWEGSCQR